MIILADATQVLIPPRPITQPLPTQTLTPQLMKNLLVFSISVLALSCNTNDDVICNQNPNPVTNNSTDEPTNELLSTWSLAKFEGGIGPTLLYNNDEIKWTFNANNNLHVEIVTGTQLYSGIPLNESGTYSYASSTTVLTLNNTESWILNINGNTMTIDQNPAADGRKLTFNKAQ